MIIGTDGFGNWQGRIPEPTGETVITRYTLKPLLDKLEELTSEAHAEPDGSLS